MVEFGSPVFGFLIYFIVGWFVTRHMENRIRARTGQDSWNTVPFLWCVLVWLPLCIWGLLTYKKE